MLRLMLRALSCLFFTSVVALHGAKLKASQATARDAETQVPRWIAPIPNSSLPLGGFSPAPGAVNVEVHHGTNATGNYNHAAMLDYHNGVFLVAWKNGPFNEDKSGQRILYVKSGHRQF